MARFGSGVPVQLAEQLADLLRDDPVPLERLGRDSQGHLLVLLPETRGVDVEQRLAVLAAKVAATRFTVNGESVRVTPITAWADFAEAESGGQLYERAQTALAAASGHLDLLPVRWSPDLDRQVATERPGAAGTRAAALLGRLKLPAQILATFVLGIGVPLARVRRPRGASAST